MKRKLLGALTLLVALGVAALPSSVPAYDQPPWDTGHQTIDPDPGDKDTDPGDDACNSSGSPFEVATGNFIHRARDLFIPALGPDIEITRTYNSRDMRSGSLGWGWSFTYDQRLIRIMRMETVVVGANPFVIYDIICRQGYGKRVRFRGILGGTFTSPPDVFSRLVQHPDGTWTLTEKDGTQRHFDTEGRLSALVDRNGNAMSFAYDAAGFLTSLTDASGRTVRFTKGANGKIIGITDPAGRVFQYAHDADANLVSFTDPLGNVTRYVYDAKHNLTQVIDPRGNTVQQMTYDAQGRVATFTEQGETWTVSYFPDQKQTTKRDSQGNTWTFSYNDNGNIIRTVDPLGNIEDLGYNAAFLISSITDKNGNTTTFTYDTRGNVSSITDPLGNITRASYEPDFSQVSSITDPLGNATGFEYDVKGNLTKFTDALGNVTRMAYGGQGQMLSFTDALGNIDRYVYDTNGNLVQTIDALGNSTAATFDTLGNLTSVTDAEAQTTQFGYDAINRLTSMTDPSGNTTRRAYDANGNLLSVTDAKGNIATFQYDIFNRLIRVTNPLGQSKTFTYDSKGNPISMTDAKGQTITFTYDVLNRLVRKSTPDNIVGFTPDAVGNLLSVSDNDSSGMAVYDKLNRLIQVTASGIIASTITYSYDANGRRTTMTDPQGGVTGYTYDALNRLVGLTTPGGETTTFSYDALSLRQVAFPTGVVTNLSYDGITRLVSLVNQARGGTISRFDYVYNKVGNRLRRTELAGVNDYAYDPLNRLISATHPQMANPRESFTYDGLDNRLSSHLSATYVYDAANRLLEDDAFTYTYDANGNRIAKTTKTPPSQTTRYTYDAENQPIRIDFPDGTFATYAYDGSGRRIEKNVNGEIKRFIYDREDVLLELDGRNAVIARYTHGPGIDAPIGVERGGNRFFYHADGLGSIIGLTDSGGNLVRSYTYDSFGQIVDAPGALENPYTYTSREIDSESQLYYYRARYYDARIGRFLQEDPSRLVGSQANLYAYVKNNPTNRLDPSGLDEQPDMPLKGEGEYKVITEDRGKSGKEDVKGLFDKVKDLWKKCGRALSGGDDPSPPPPSDKPQKPKLKDFPGK